MPITSTTERHDIPALKVAPTQRSTNAQDSAAAVTTSPLQAAIAAVQMVQIALEKGAILNDLNKGDKTPAAQQQGVGRHIHAGCEYWTIDMYRLLVLSTAPPNRQVGVTNEVVADGK
jgi:hypothetical protein